MKSLLRHLLTRTQRRTTNRASFRPVGTIAFILVLVMLGNDLYIVISENQVLSQQLDAQGSSLASTAAAFAVEPLLIRDYPVLETFAQKTVQEKNGVLQVRISRHDGMPVVDVQAQSTLADSEKRDYSAPIRVDPQSAEPLGMVQISLSTEHVETLMQTRLWVLGGSSLLICLGLTTFIVWILRMALQLQYSERVLRRHRNQLARANQKIHDSHAQLVQSEKMASLGILTAGVAHEINNPIGFIKNNLTSLDDYMRIITPTIIQARASGATFDGDIDFILEDIAPLLADTREGTERVEQIVSGLKDFSRTNDKAKRYFDLNHCVEATLKVIWSSIKYKAEVDKQLGEIPLLYGNPGELNQVIMNLLINATQAIDENGKIRIETRQRGEEVLLKISDNGCGIAAENIPRLFTPFFTTKEVGVGTGLGLSISHGLITKHGGSIQVDSRPGAGSSFSVSLPLQTD